MPLCSGLQSWAQIYAVVTTAAFAMLLFCNLKSNIYNTGSIEDADDKLRVSGFEIGKFKAVE
jgi:hypothetical protein